MVFNKESSSENFPNWVFQNCPKFTMTRGAYAVATFILMWYLIFNSVHNIFVPTLMRAKKKDWPCVQKWENMAPELK